MQEGRLQKQAEVVRLKVSLCRTHLPPPLSKFMFRMLAVQSRLESVHRSMHAPSQASKLACAQIVLDSNSRL